MKKIVLYVIIASVFALGASAQEVASDEVQRARKMKKYDGPEVLKLVFDGRFGWRMFNTAGTVDRENTGFRGEFLNIQLDARLYKGFSFSWRQRMNKNTHASFWDATDWMELRYAPTEKWLISAGKQVVAVGGYEYDRAPIDLYDSNCEFWNQIACYQFGVSAAYRFNENHKLTFQFSNSPYRTYIADEKGNGASTYESYGFSLMWNGKVGMWETIWSGNAFQNTKNRWMYYIALGNKFNFVNNRLWMELDYVNRASCSQTFFFDDFSVIAELSGRPHSCLRLFAKYNYDVNKSGTDGDVYVLDGTEMHGVSGGIEYEPLKKHPEMVRLFAAAGYSWGVNTNTAYGAMLDKQVRVNAGVKIKLDVLKGIKWAVKKWQ